MPLEYRDNTQARDATAVEVSPTNPLPTTLKAGTAVIGSVKIDQTTPGTTNGVQVNAALPAGTALIGKVGVDQTTPGTTNLVATISGQNGVAGGSGVVGATTQRVVLATDVALPAGENHIGEVGGKTAKPSANFTRPNDTTAYASGDLVANSTTAGSVTPLSWTVARVAAGSGMIRRCRVRKSGTSVTNSSFRLHLYTVSPTPANGDNGAWSTDQVATYMGAMDVTIDRAFTDGAAGNGAPNTGSEINFALASGQTIYGLLEARGAYTPSAQEVFTVELEILQN